MQLGGGGGPRTPGAGALVRRFDRCSGVRSDGHMRAPAALKNHRLRPESEI